MNKIFKIVFNAARGKMMVVNEATSSVQAGKKAAVTVAVIGALASGAAMADATVLDSNQFGDEIFNTGGSFVVENSALKLQNVTSTKASLYLVGGPSLKGNAQNNLTVGSAEKEAQGEYASSVSVTNAEFSGTTFVVGAGLMEASGSSKPTPNTNYKADAKYFGTSVELTDVNAASSYVIGGGKIYNAGRGTIEVTNTNINLAGNTVVGTVVGGSFVSGSNAKTTVLKTETTNVYIGQGVKVTGDVIGGHYHNWYGETASVGTTNVVLDGATMSGENAVVIGGNFIQVVERTDAAAMNVSSNVAQANVTVKNSVVGAIYAGDYVINDAKALSSMETVAGGTSLYVENSTVNGDVVGGSYITGKNAVSVVEPSDVAIEMVNTVVNGMITSDSVGVAESLAKSDSKKSISLTNVISDSLQASSGTVELRAEGDGKTIIGELSVGDDITVGMTTDGAANDAAGGDITKVIVIGSGDFGATVNMAAGEVMGSVTATVKDGEVIDKTIAVNEKTDALADKVTMVPQMVNRIMMNDLRKRMGDVRAGEGTHGAWVRYNGGEMSAQGMDVDFNMIQVGIDTVPVVDAPRFGMAFSYAQSEAKDGFGTADMDAYSLAFYGTKMYDNGMFVDVIGRMATMDADIADSAHKGKMDNVALSLSGEFGWRFNLTDSFFIEPSVEATYTYTNADTFTMTNGGTYELEATDSLIGRAGFAAGFKCPANKGDVYVRAAVVHEFSGDVTMNSMVSGAQATPVSVDGKDTWVEFGIGANFNVNKNTYVYADIERTEGAKLEEDWRANVGVRFAF